MYQKQDNITYKELLLLAYFKNNYKVYEYSEAVRVLGVTYDELKIMITMLIKKGLLLQTKEYLIISKCGEEILTKQKLDIFFEEKENINKREKWNIDKPYIPLDFHL